MSKFLRSVGKVAGVVAAVALIGSGIGTALGGTMMLTAFGSSIAASSIAAVAGAISAVAMSASQTLAKKPAAQGQVERRLFGANTPLPYAIGRTYTPGVQVHDTAWGGKVGKVWNPYRFLAIVLSCAGPVASIDSVWFDHAEVPFSGAAATGYYGGFVWKDEQLGEGPESAALAAAPGQSWGTPPGWSGAHKLSGFAAIALSLKYDKEGKVFAQGVPPIGVVGHWVKTYDARQDSSFPGGSGAHRIDDEATWEWSECPAQHAVAYAYGRVQNGQKIFGPGIEISGIDLDSAVAWANVCEANGWTTGGVIYEPGDAWNNLKRICQAGGCEPVAGADGILRFNFLAPRVSLASIGAGDLKGDAAEAVSGRTFRERVATIVPRFRSEANQWNYVQATEQTVEAFQTDDRPPDDVEEIQYDLVQDADQAAELALYEIYQRREPVFNVTLGPVWKNYQPGDTLTLLAECGLWEADIDVVIRRKSIDPLTGLIDFELEGENPDKHDEVLGATADAPPVVDIPTAQDRDFAFGFNLDPLGYGDTLIATSSQRGLTINATDAAITISDHERVYSDKVIEVDGDTLTAPTDETLYYLYYDDEARAGGAVTWVATEDFFEAQNSPENPGRHYGGYIVTDVIGGTGTTGGGAVPPGSGGVNPYEVLP